MRAAIAPLGVRLPAEVKERIKAEAVSNRRSMNAEIIIALERFYSISNSNEKADATAS